MMPLVAYEEAGLVAFVATGQPALSVCFDRDKQSLRGVDCESVWQNYFSRWHMATFEHYRTKLVADKALTSITMETTTTNI